jgi:hypothetical protein
MLLSNVVDGSDFEFSADIRQRMNGFLEKHRQSKNVMDNND